MVSLEGVGFRGSRASSESSYDKSSLSEHAIRTVDVVSFLQSNFGKVRLESILIFEFPTVLFIRT